MKILNRYTKEVIFECEKETMKGTVIEAMKSKANLSEADLSKADLSKADLSKADLMKNTYYNKTKISYRGKIVEINFTEIK